MFTQISYKVKTLTPNQLLNLVCWQLLWLFSAGFLSAFAYAQTPTPVVTPAPGSSCVASVYNRNVNLEPDFSYAVVNLPSTEGIMKVRVTCSDGTVGPIKGTSLSGLYIFGPMAQGGAKIQAAHGTLAGPGGMVFTNIYQLEAGRRYPGIFAITVP